MGRGGSVSSNCLAGGFSWGVENGELGELLLKNVHT
jgi:hypothetical protein